MIEEETTAQDCNVGIDVGVDMGSNEACSVTRNTISLRKRNTNDESVSR